MSSLHDSITGAKSFRFGVFEVDLEAGQLRKHGLRIRLPEQSFQILALLLERAGEVVTREQLQERLWPADSFVDFDHGLNKAINKIREALGDSAATPRFVETLPRRGYRFIAAVEEIAPSPVDPKSLAMNAVPGVAAQCVALRSAGNTFFGPQRSHFRRPLWRQFQRPGCCITHLPPHFRRAVRF